ncbi:hypothetical protein, partial [Cyclobacterium sp.]|uniref:hypothetical protein n=1 Tax=Cyclobacterium sp. TaxID=1966343 RepID=UPI001992C32F
MGWVFLSLTLLLFLVLLFIRSPFGQDIIVNRLTSYVSGKTHTNVAIDRLFITFGGEVYLEGLYLEDMQGDTLLYSEKLETGMALIPFLRTGEIKVTGLDWEGLQANVQRDNTGQFNFDFLLEAFTSPAAEGDSAATESSTKKSAFPELSLGPVNLEDWEIQFADELSGMSVELDLGTLQILTEKLDLNRMDFHIGKIQWENTDLKYLQTKAFPEAAEEEPGESPLPLLVLDQLSLANINLHYQSDPDGMDVLARLGAFNLELPEADMEKERLQVKSLLLEDSFLDYQSKTLDAPSSQKPVNADSSALVWPEWKINIGAVDLVNNEIKYRVDQQEAPSGQFDPNDLGLSALNLKLNQVFLEEGRAGASLKALSFRERSGFSLENFQMDLSVEEQMTSIEDLELTTGNSKLLGNTVLRYTGLAGFLNNPDQSRFDINVQQLSIGLQDAYYFSPELRNDPYLKTLAGQKLNTKLSASGGRDRIKINELSGAWGKKTTFKMLGLVDNPLEPERLAWKVDTLNFVTVNTDINKFIPEDSLGLTFPETLELGMNSSGSMDSFSLNTGLNAYGAEFVMAGRIASQGEAFTYDLQASLDEAPLGEILDLEDFGKLGFEIKASGNTGPLERLDLNLDTRMTNLEWKGHDYSGMKLLANISEGKGEVEMRHQDEFLEMELLADAVLNPEDLQVDLDLDLKGADFYRLNISPNNLRGSMQLTASWNGNASSFDLQTKISDGTVVLEDQAYPLGSWDMNLNVMRDTTDFTIDSNILKGELQANADPAAAMDGLFRHFNRYLENSSNDPAGGIDSLQRVAVNLKMEIIPGLLLDQVVLPDLEGMDKGSIAFDFDESKAHLTGSVDFPYLSYAGIVVDSLGVRVNSDAEDFGFAFGLLGLESGPLALGPTYFTGEILEKQLYMDFNALDGEEVLAHIAFDVDLAQDSLKLHVHPDSLFLNKKRWSVPEVNEVWFADSSLVFNDFTFSRENQNLSFYNKPEGNTIGLKFENFRLATFTSLLNPDEMVATGRVDGDFVVENPFGATGLLADISISDLNVLQVPLGNLALNAASKTDQKNYDFNLALRDEGIELELGGDYLADTSGAQLNLNLDMEKLEMAVLEGLSQGAISGAEGYLSGAFSVNGKTNAPEYQGKLRFNNTAFKVATLNAGFSLKDEEITLDNQ